MTQDEIIEVAKEIAAQYIKAERFQTWTYDYVMQRLMELAEVAASKEREACALICAQRAKDFEDLLKKYGHEHDDGARVGASQCEQMIRARGNT